MPEKSQLSKRQSFHAALGSIRLAFRDSPSLIIILAIEEVISRSIPFINAWLAAQLINILPSLNSSGVARDRAVHYVIYIAVVTIIPTIIDVFTKTYEARRRMELGLKVQRRLDLAFSSLPYPLYEDKNTLDAYDRAKRFSDSLANFVQYRLKNIFGAAVSLTIATIAFWHFSAWLTVVIFVLTIPAFAIELKLQALREKTWRRNTLNYRKSQIHEDIFRPNIIKESRLLNLITFAVDRSQHYKRKAESAQIVVEQTANKFRIASIFIDAFLGVIILLQVLKQISRGTIGIGQFVFVQQLLSQYLGALREGSWIVQDFDDMLFGASEYTDIVNHPKEATGEDIHDPHGDIKLENVSFSYPLTDSKSLDDLTMTIPAGKTTAIVGENGAGKTTLIKLLMKLYEPSAGSISIGGQKLSGINSTNWHKSLGVLFQDFQIYYGFTILDNISFGDRTKQTDPTKMKEYTNNADISSYLDELPKKELTMLGKYMDEENGTDLSGGQSQRLAIARTLYRDPAILILDEPTSAIDAKAEYKIFKQLETARKGKTTILISHRFSTIRRADYIYVLEKGKLIESGSHQELMDHDGTYKEMFDKQAEGYR